MHRTLATTTLYLAMLCWLAACTAQERVDPATEQPKDAPTTQPEPQPAAEPTMIKRKLALSFEVSTAGYQFTLQEIRRVGDELWVVCELIRPTGIVAEVISTVSIEREVALPEALPIKYVVIGAKPLELDPTKYAYYPERKAIADELKAAQQLYPQ